MAFDVNDDTFVLNDVFKIYTTICILPLKVLLVASEAMTASKCPLRSYLVSDSKPVALIILDCAYCLSQQF